MINNLDYANYSTRQVRVCENIKEAMNQIMTSGAFLDERLFEKLITVSRVKITPDLQNATIFIYSISNKDDVKKILEGFIQAVPRIRTLLAKKVYFKRVPMLHFKVDDTFERADQIYKTIDKISATN